MRLVLAMVLATTACAGPASAVQPAVSAAAEVATEELSFEFPEAI